LLERRHRWILITVPQARAICVPAGFSVLDIGHAVAIPRARVCGEHGRCSTCWIRFISNEHTPPAATAVTAEPHRRLACQLHPDGDLAGAPRLTPQMIAAETHAGA